MERWARIVWVAGLLLVWSGTVIRDYLEREQTLTAVASNAELEHDEVRDRESDVGLELYGQDQAYEAERCPPRSRSISELPSERACGVRDGGAPRRDTPRRCSSRIGLLSAHGELVGRQPHENDCGLVRRRCVGLTVAHPPGERRRLPIEPGGR